MKKHIICHIHCLDHPSVFKIIDNLVKYNATFTGEKIATVTRIGTEPYIFDSVSSILKKLGYTIIVTNNDSLLRETSRFFDIALPSLLEKTSDGILYYCHSKGVIYHPESKDGLVTSLWTDVLLHYTLHNSNDYPFEDTTYSTFGTCRVPKKGFLPDEIGENFCYVGTFFWVRLNKLIGKTFSPHSKFYLEGLPGLVCELSESYNNGPELTPLEGPYEIETWNKKGIYYGFPNQN
jgi:hypothetical protein